MSKPRLFYTDGVIVNRSCLFVTAGFNADRDADSSMLIGKFGQTWAGHGVPEDMLVSLTYSAKENRVFALGKNGIVKSVGTVGVPFSLESVRGKFRTDWIADAQDRGPLERITVVGDSIYACGWAGQIYALRRGVWSRADDGIDAANFDFLNIGGFSENNLFAIGLQGIIFHYDGRHWSRVDSPTNQHLYDIALEPGGKVMIAGAEGVLLSGDSNGFQVLDVPTGMGNLWSVECYAERLFVAHSHNRISCLSEQTWQPIAIQAGEPVTTYRLSSRDSVLLSIGASTLATLDGEQWTTLQCPEG